MRRRGTGPKLAGATAALACAIAFAACEQRPRVERILLSFGSAADSSLSYFGTTPDADRGLLWPEDGWSHAPPGKPSWAVGPESSIQLWLSGRDHRLRIVLRTAPDLAALGQEVELLFDGAAVDTLALPEPWTDVESVTKLPESSHRRGYHTLTLRPSHHHPGDDGLYGDDLRQHSVLLVALEIAGAVTDDEFRVFDETIVPEDIQREFGSRTLASTGSGIDPPKLDDDERPDILVLVLDAARPDHFSCYGYKRETTPYMDTLARDGIRFTNAFSTAAYTRAAIPSLMTGLGWRSHGVLELEHALADSFTTMAELFRDSGYHTWGVSANPNASSTTGSSQGFDRWADVWRNPRLAEFGLAELPVRLVENRLAKGLGERPVFAYVHLIPPHEPYQPGPEHDLWHVDGASKWVDGTVDCLERFIELAGGWEERDLEKLISLYDGNLHRADSHVERIVEAWRRHRERNLRIVLLSDHGEAFGEHATVGHNSTSFDEMVRIPLILWPAADFGQWSERRDELFAITDVLPLLARNEGLFLPDWIAWPGRFLELLEGRRTRRSAIVLKNNQPGISVRTPEHLLLSNGWEIQQLYGDAEQRLDRRAAEPKEFLEAASQLFAITRMQGQALGESIETTRDEEEALRALGYN